jgi:HPt (histidine-containing phosphotransfer) domain-containing protein
MLIYNFKKEFIGIDEEDLSLLGFKNLEELNMHSPDFADLFVKTPGYIHNFKHLHWIDYIISAESSKDSKVIIRTNNNDYTCNLDIKTLYLVDNPSSKAYLINLVNLRVLSDDTVEQTVIEIEEPHISEPEVVDEINSEPEVDTEIADETNSEPEEESAVQDDIVSEDVIDETIPNNDESSQITTEEKVPQETPMESKLDDYFKIDLDMDDVQEKEVDEKKLQEKKISRDEKSIPAQKVYIYDPHVASSSLGLPIDLIKEFLEDFIAQADEFKDKIYKSINELNMIETKSLCHKLKGVAANLRIEDALEVLTVANTSNNFDEIKLNIDKFYKIMSTLSVGESFDSTQEDSAPAKVEEKIIQDDDDDYDESLFINFDEDTTKPVEEEIIKYDKTLAAKEIGIEDEFFNELLSDYTKDSMILIDSINEAIQNGDSTLWKKSAHTLKGMSDNMRIKHFMQELDELIKTDDAKIAKETIDKISSVLKQIL